MNAEEFEAGLLRDGFEQMPTEGMKAGLFIDHHTHPFKVRGLVIEGEMRLTIDGQTQVCLPGDVFVMPANHPHQENIGAGGVRYIYGRRDGA